MTCIVGLVHNGTVWMGTDSAGSDGVTYIVVKNKKVFRSNKMLLGFTSSWRMGQLLQTSLQVPRHQPKVDDFTYLTSTFIDVVLECFKDKTFAKVENNVVEGGTFLVGYRGHIYMVQDDFSIVESTLPYIACGSGQAHAQGALHALTKTNLSPKVKIIKALEAAAAFNCGVYPPFYVTSLPGQDRNE